MPIYDIECDVCGYSGELLVMNRDGDMVCPSCGSDKTARLMSVTSSLTGRDGQKLPGPHDSACCGSRPGEASNCAGPGSCCGQR